MQITMIPLDRVVPDPGQPRQNFPQSHINALAESIKTRGLRNPIHVRPSNGDGTYPLINGECRTRAFTQLGEKEIPAIIFETEDDAKVFMDQIMDNVVRKDMDIMETVEAYQKALDMDVAVTDLAKAFGISVGTIEKDLPLLKLPKSLQRDLDQKVLSKEIGRKLADLHPSYSHDKIQDAWKYVRRAPSTEGQVKRLEVWKTQEGQGKTDLELTKDETTAKERKKFAGAVGRFMGHFTTFSKKVSENSNFLTGAMYGLHNQIGSGQFGKDLDHAQKILDQVKDALKEYEAHKDD